MVTGGDAVLWMRTAGSGGTRCEPGCFYTLLTSRRRRAALGSAAASAARTAAHLCIEN